MEIKSIVEQISPMRRMINSPGMDLAFQIVKSHLPEMVIHEYFPGETADDWEVPYSWELREAFIKNEKGDVIACDRDSHLFVAAYSEPIHGKFTKEEISSHIRCHPVLKNAFFMEHRNAYNYSLVDWGITLPQNIWDNLSSTEIFEVYIDVVKDYSRSMKVGEMTIKGKSEKIILFTAHIDELCNDNLSSCAVLIEFFKTLNKKGERQNEYTYQLLLVPEIIGTFYFVKNNLANIKNTVAMINLETVGRGENWLIKQSLNPVKYIDKIMKLAAEQVLINYKISDMFSGYGNEERVYEYPTISIPSVALQRFPFDEYHSSEDTPSKISEENLRFAFEFVSCLVNILEKDYIPEYVFLLPPWLTKHGLYFDSKDQADLFNLFMNKIQFNINGKNSLVDLCYMFDVKFNSLFNYLEKFVDKKFIKPKLDYDFWKN